MERFDGELAAEMVAICWRIFTGNTSSPRKYGAMPNLPEFERNPKSYDAYKGMFNPEIDAEIDEGFSGGLSYVRKLMYTSKRYSWFLNSPIAPMIMCVLERAAAQPDFKKLSTCKTGLTTYNYADPGERDKIDKFYDAVVTHRSFGLQIEDGRAIAVSNSLQSIFGGSMEQTLDEYMDQAMKAGAFRTFTKMLTFNRVAGVFAFSTVAAMIVVSIRKIWNDPVGTGGEKLDDATRTVTEDACIAVSNAIDGNSTKICEKAEEARQGLITFHNAIKNCSEPVRNALTGAIVGAYNAAKTALQTAGSFRIPELNIWDRPLNQTEIETLALEQALNEVPPLQVMDRNGTVRTLDWNAFLLGDVLNPSRGSTADISGTIHSSVQTERFPSSTGSPADASLQQKVTAEDFFMIISTAATTVMNTSEKPPTLGNTGAAAVNFVTLSSVGFALQETGEDSNGFDTNRWPREVQQLLDSNPYGNEVEQQLLRLFPNKMREATFAPIEYEPPVLRPPKRSKTKVCIE